MEDLLLFQCLCQKEIYGNGECWGNCDAVRHHMEVPGRDRRSYSARINSETVLAASMLDLWPCCAARLGADLLGADFKVSTRCRCSCSSWASVCSIRHLLHVLSTGDTPLRFISNTRYRRHSSMGLDVC
jgi:hypothetical protein